MHTETAQASDRWKQKYYDSLAELERKERQWGEVDGVLRRSISRLTFLGDGVDPDLDRQLERLRNIIRDERDNTRLQRMVDAIAETALRLEKRNKAHRRAPLDAAAVFGELLDAVTFPRRLDKKVAAFRKRLAPGANEDGLAQAFAGLLAEAFAALQARATDGAENAAPAAAPTERNETRNRRAEQADAEPEPAASAADLPRHDTNRAAPRAPAADGALLLRLLARLKLPLAFDAELAALKRRAAAPAADWQPLIDELADLIGRTDGAPAAALSVPEALIQLLENLSLPAELDAKVEALKTRLAAGIDATGLAPALKSVAGLIDEAQMHVQRERREIEKFLKQLTERLQLLDAHLQGEESARGETLASGRRLDAAVRDEVRGIETSVRGAENLEQLKTVIHARLEAIDTHMREHREAEEARSRQREQEIKDLGARLQEMETETGTLRGRIQKERDQAQRDPLTGIYNRLAYDERIAQEYARWKRYQSPLSLILWDLDYFKRINDSYGHKAGDKVLRTIAQIFAAQLRATDFTARYGGEEFVSLLPETDLTVALTVAEKLRAAVAQCGFHFRGAEVPITLSCGVVQFRGADTPESAFERADVALYAAKQGGRNQCSAGDANAGAQLAAGSN